METFLYILLALVVLLVMITVHEFGHYCAGKVFGFKINEFAIGFGPALFKRTKKDGEVFSVRALPLGGFCAFEGEDEQGNTNPDAFNNKPAWKRLIVLLAGVTFNFLFGILTAAIYLMVNGFSTAMIAGSVNPAEVTGSGLQTGDIVISVNGKTVEAYRSFTELTSKYGKNDTFTVTVNRDGEIIDVTSSKREYSSFYFVYNSVSVASKIYNATGEKYNIDQFVNDIMRIDASSETTDRAGKGDALKTYFAENIYKQDGTKYTDAEVEEFVADGYFVYVPTGVGMGISYVNHFEDYSFFEAILKAWPFCFYLCGLILSSLAGLFTGATAISDMGGTVTAVSQIAEVSKMGINYFLLLLPLLAMNLALFNVLPIPALDGARAVFVLIEMIFRKRVPEKIEGWIHTIGLFVLLGLVIFLDVYHFAFASAFLRLWKF